MLTPIFVFGGCVSYAEREKRNVTQGFLVSSHYLAIYHQQWTCFGIKKKLLCSKDKVIFSHF